MKINSTFLLLSFLLLLGFACTEVKENSSRKKRIVTTTNIIADGVRNIVGDSAEVIALMGAGVDPHLYKASQGDVQKLSNADIIVYNGLHLEGKMTTVLEKLSKNKTVLAMSNGISENRFIVTNATANTHDPHIWFDVLLWKQALENLGNALAQSDSANAGYYLQNTKKYVQELNQLHDWVGVEINKIPERQKLIITAHDAFSYYGRAYHIEVKGLQGISTLSDFGLQDITALIDLIVSRNIKAVFIETSISPKSIEALVEGCKSKGHSVSIGGTLYSDALGDANTPQGTYIGMVKHNTSLIAKSLH